MDELLSRIQQIHTDCFKVCYGALGKYLPVAGNVGIFCQSEEEFEHFTKLREETTYPSDNSNQKYFELKNYISIGNPHERVHATYTHLYVRKPNSESPEAGDMDFVLPRKEYSELKQRVLGGEIKGASIYNRPGWDMIEIRDLNINALAYICTEEMAKKVRIKFD